MAKTLIRAGAWLAAYALAMGPVLADYQALPLRGSDVQVIAPNSPLSESAQDAYARTINGVSYGARGSTYVTSAGTVIATGANLLTLDTAGDFVVGDDIRLQQRGPLYSGGTLTNLTAATCGVPGAIPGCLTTGATSCTYWVTQDDGSGGTDAAQAIPVANSQPDIGTVNSVYISYTPTNSDYSGPVWKDCGSGETYIGAAQPRITFSVTAGSGYTDGGYPWTAAGPCANPPTGWVQVVGSKLVGGRVDPSPTPWRCTGAPTVSVPGITGIGAGNSGAIHLALAASLNDTGVVPAGGLPSYLPSTHPTTPRYDWYVATIGAISLSPSVVFTLCVPGSSPCTPANASTGGSGFTVYHSWTRAIQATIDAASIAAAGKGVVYASLGCGTYDFEPPLSIATNETILTSPGRDCVILKGVGTGNRIVINPVHAAYLAQVGVENIHFDSRNATSGYDVSSIRTLHLHYESLYTALAPCSFQALGFNLGYFYHLDGNSGWGDNCSDFDFESTSLYPALVPLLLDTYHNHGLGISLIGGMQHHGYVFDDVPSAYATGQCAVSSAPGRAFWFKDDSGFGYNTAIQQSGQHNFSEHLQCDEEYSRLTGWQVDNCFLSCENNGFANGSMYGPDLYVSAGQHFDWIGGHLNGAGQTTGGSPLAPTVAAPGAYLGGLFNRIVNTTVGVNSQNNHGQSPGVEIGPTSLGAVVGLNDISPVDGVFGAGFQSAPVTLDAGATFTGTISGTTLTVSGLSGPLAHGSSVYDSSHVLSGCPSACPFIVDGAGSTWTLNKAPGNFGPEAMISGPSRGAVTPNSFVGNVVNHVVDNSGMPGNVILPNAGDDSNVTKPTIATNGCGSTTQGSLATPSSDWAGSFTVGTATVTSCAITFALPHTLKPLQCQITAEAVSGPSFAVTRTTSGFTVAFASDAASRVYDYNCVFP